MLVRRARTVGTITLALTFWSCQTAERPPEVWVSPRTDVQVFGPDGAPEPGIALADQIYGVGATPAAEPVDWDRVADVLQAADRATARAPQDPEGAPPEQDTGEQDPAAGTEPGEQDPDADADPAARLAIEQQRNQERLQAEARLRNAFGEAILINDDGSVTKQYFLSRGASAVFTSLLTPLEGAKPAQIPAGTNQVGGDAVDTVLGRMLGADNPVGLVFIANFEQFQNMAPRAAANTPAKLGEQGTNSLLLVTARPKALAAFENALNLFYANIPQVEIEVKVVEYATSNAVSFGIQPLDENTPTLQNLSSGRLIQQITSNFPLSAPLSGAGSTDDRGLITLGGIHDTWELNAVLEALETSNIADIKSQPRMVVRNGGVATVSTLTEQPFPKARISNQTVATTDVSFKPVGVVMDIRPEIVGTETVVLNVFISVSAVTGFAPTDPVATPIVATREATTSVHLSEGESTVIGGLVSESVFDSETKLPILGDIPILGYLFRSTTTQKQNTTLEFHITPRIRWGARGTRPSGTGF